MAFVMEMIDKITGPARRAASALGPVRQALRTVGAGASSAVSKLASVGGSLAAITGVVAGSAGVLAAKGTEMLVDSLTFQQSTKSAFSAIEGSQQQGEALYNHVLEMAKHFRQSPKDMMMSVMSLKAAGMETAQALSLLQTTMDLSAFKPGADIKALVTQLGQAKSKGKLMTEEMMVLAESGGLATGKIKEALIGVLGLGEVNPKNLDKIQALLSGGKITADQGITAVQKAVASLTGVKQAGEYADKARNSVGALINGLKAAPEQFLLRMSVEDGPLRKLLLMLNELFDPTTESGKRMLASLNKIGAQIMGIFGKMGTPENMQRVEKLIMNLIKLLPIMITLFAISIDVFVFLFDVLANVKDNFMYCWEQSNLFKGALIALAVVLSPLLIVIAALGVAVGLLSLPFIAVGAAIYGAWLLLVKLKDAAVSAISSLAKLLGLQASLDTAKGGVASSVIEGGAKIAPPGSATPTPAAQLAGSKTANIQIGDISVKSVDGDNPTTKTVANDVAAKVRREITAAMRGAAGELG